MQLARTHPPRRLISLVSMVDVLLIMLVFFMVTSSYLDLDMVPVAQSDEAPPPSTQAAAAPGAPMMVRLGPDGSAYIRGRIAERDALVSGVQAHLSQNPQGVVLILPSPRADTQSLVTLMDTVTQAGGTNLRILQMAVRE